MNNFKAMYKATMGLWRQEIQTRYFPQMDQLYAVPPWRARKYATKKNIALLEGFIGQVGVTEGSAPTITADNFPETLRSAVIKHRTGLQAYFKTKHDVIDHLEADEPVLAWWRLEVFKSDWPQPAFTQQADLDQEDLVFQDDLEPSSFPTLTEEQQGRIKIRDITDEDRIRVAEIYDFTNWLRWREEDVRQIVTPENCKLAEKYGPEFLNANTENFEVTESNFVSVIALIRKEFMLWYRRLLAATIKALDLNRRRQTSQAIKALRDFSASCPYRYFKEEALNNIEVVKASAPRLRPVPPPQR